MPVETAPVSDAVIPGPRLRPRRPLYRRILWWGVITAAIVFVLFAIAWVSYSAWTHRQLAHERQLVIDAGEPLDWTAFYQRFPRTPAVQAGGDDAPADARDEISDLLFPMHGKAADLADRFYAAAIEFRRHLHDSEEPHAPQIMLSVMRGEMELTPELTQRVRQWLDHREMMFELLERAAAMPRCSYRLPRMSGGEIPELYLWRGVANDLVTRAQWQVLQNNPDAAADTILCMLHGNRVLDSDPYLITYLVQNAIEVMAMTEVEGLLAAGPSEAALARLAEGLQRIDVDRLERALMGERIWMIEREGDAIASTVREAWFGGINERVPMPPPVERHYKVTELRSIRQALRAVGRPYPEQAALYPATSAPFVGVDRIVIMGYSGLATIRAARIAVAMEFFRRRHAGPLPRSLDQLVSGALLDAPPLDPFTGEPMKLLVTDQGYTIYSIGEDGNDDGGDVSLRANRRYPDIGVAVPITPAR